MAQAEITHANCGHCGAPLPVSSGPVVVCQYCRREHRVVSAPQHSPAPKPNQGNASALWAILGTGGMVAVGLGVTALRIFMPPSFGAAASAANPRALSAPTAAAPGSLVPTGSGPMTWYDYPPTVLASGASAAAPNLIGMTYWLSGGSQLTAVDGATGKLAWRVPSSNNVRAYSNAADVLLTFDDSKKLTRLDPKTGKSNWSSTLGDEVYDLTLGSNCASLLRSSGQTLGIHLQTGEQSPCPTAPTPQFPSLRDKLVDVTGTSGDLSFVGSVQLDDKPVNPEPPRLAIQVSRAGHVLWKVVPTTLEPYWTSEGFHRSLLLTPAGLFVFGMNGSDHQERWLLLELSTGRTLYQRASTFKVDRPIQLTRSGELVFVQHDQRLAAYRAATGELVWSQP